jgi:hypothetical protein
MQRGKCSLLSVDSAVAAEPNPLTAELNPPSSSRRSILRRHHGRAPQSIPSQIPTPYTCFFQKAIDMSSASLTSRETAGTVRSPRGKKPCCCSATASHQHHSARAMGLTSPHHTSTVHKQCFALTLMRDALEAVGGDVSQDAAARLHVVRIVSGRQQHGGALHTRGKLRLAGFAVHLADSQAWVEANDSSDAPRRRQMERGPVAGAHRHAMG